MAVSFFRNAAEALTPPWYVRRATSTTTCRPVAVVVRAKASRMISIERQSMDWSDRVRWQNRRWSIGLYLEQYGGRWDTRMDMFSRTAVWHNCSRNSDTRYPLLPPQSANTNMPRARE